MSAALEPVTMGTYEGIRRQVARALRAVTRPPLPAWTADTIDIDAAAELLNRHLRTASPIGSVITWVPGHDATPGPGHTIATIAADAWQLPLIAMIDRTRPIPSALISGVRPSAHRQATTMTALCGHHHNVILVDNVIATGSTIAAARHVLESAGNRVTSLVAAAWSRPDTYWPAGVADGGRPRRP